MSRLERPTLYISHLLTRLQVFCQLVSKSDKLEALMAEVGDFHSGNHLEVELTAGAYWVAQYSEKLVVASCSDHCRTFRR